MSLSNFEESNLAKVWKNEAPTKAAALFVQLHVGDPGEDCTANVAKDTTRREVSLGAISGGLVKNDELLEWTATDTETITHASVWDASSAGNPRIYGALSAPAELTEGEPARFAVEALSLALA